MAIGTLATVLPLPPRPVQRNSSDLGDSLRGVARIFEWGDERHHGVVLAMQANNNQLDSNITVQQLAI